MRIDLKTYGLEPPDKNGEDAKTGKTASSPGQTQTSDRTRFSFDKTRVESLEKRVLAEPEVREQKVELLRQAIGKGQYAVSDSQIAAAIAADFGAALTVNS